MNQEAKRETFNLFAYGTLKNPAIMRAVLGKRLVTHRSQLVDEDTVLAKRAVLNGYKTISPDNTYLYAMPARHSRIQGYMVGPLSLDLLPVLRKYEGRNYRRRKVRVATRKGREEAIVFLGNTAQLEHSFGYAFRDDFKQEILLREKIEAALLEAEQKRLQTADVFTRRALGELCGPRIRDMVRHHFEAGGISDYAIRQSLLDAPLPNFERIRNDAKAKALAPNYLSMVIRQVVFNQIEERIHHDCHYELDQMCLRKDMYDRTISSLAAMRILNARPDILQILVGDCLNDLTFPKNNLVEFVRLAVIAADAFYEPQQVKHELDFISNNMGSRGYIPLGAELEFSNIGHEVILDPQAKRVHDREYDGFMYFTDFGLDVLTWKLGGHVDDHYVKASPEQRRGFFELALGSLSIEENISMPITDDPWVLNQIINETRQFYGHVAPHSIHISMQLRSSRHRPTVDRPPPLSVLKCLFALAGDPGPDSNGNIVIHRLKNNEIVRKDFSGDSDQSGQSSLKANALQFSRVSKRQSSSSDETYAAVRTSRKPGRYVQQFKFMRLGDNANYELIAVALKGLQMGMSLGSFLTVKQHDSNQAYRKRFHKLLDWGSDPKPLEETEIESFLGPVYRGLITEHRGKPAHSEAYIAWAINQVREMLHGFNDLLTATKQAGD
ncbi:MAG: gamma-glutamylcyclotransferase family protein [Phycisphaerae bacterium]|nr:gamma-glutamylcyclotransferase family protein [Phycisphaerae bacterium]